MKGYVYTMYAGADPGYGWKMTDPIFGRVPTLGACVPNIRRLVQPGDYVFAVSGRVPHAQQFIVGGFRVSEKIDALAAFKRFPHNRLQLDSDGQIVGNIIVDAKGLQHRLDNHSNFANRVENYLVGTDANYFQTVEEYEVARAETVDVLSTIFEKPGKRVYDVIGRYRKMDAQQVDELRSWIEKIKS